MKKSASGHFNTARNQPSYCRRLMIATVFFLLAVFGIILLLCYFGISKEDIQATVWVSVNPKSTELSDEDIEQELLRLKREVLLYPVSSGQQVSSRLYCDALNPCVLVCHDWLESYRSVDRGCLETLANNSTATLSSQEDCSEQEQNRPLVMGNAGGDPIAFCENTFEATEAGLAAGMNAVRLDLSMSTEGVIFLWRDHLPESLTARIRQNGILFVDKCKPMYLPRSFRPAHTLSWGQIRSSWFYTDVSNSPQEANIPTLDDWVFNYGSNKQIEKVWLDVHCPDFLVDEILLRAWKIFDNHGIASKLYYTARVNGTIHFPRYLHFITELSIQNEISRLGRTSFEQLSNLILSPLTDRQVKVVTNEDFVLFTLIRKSLNNESSLESAAEETSSNIFFDLVLNGKLMERVTALKNVTDSCRNVIVWASDTASNVGDLKCLATNVEAIITTQPAKLSSLSCEPPDARSIRDPVTEASKPDELPSPRGQSCDFPCPRNLWPVCGTDGRVYGNECMLLRAACESGNLDLKVRNEGSCDSLTTEQPQTTAEQKREKCQAIEADSVCLNIDFDIENTVCGSDGRLYENRCVFEKEQCRVTSLVEDKNCLKHFCSLKCSQETNPLCGTDNITYRNFCAMKKMNCNSLLDTVEVFHYGSCGHCNFQCPAKDNIEAVCDKDTVTYENKCEMYRSACREGHPKFVLHSGPCSKRKI